MSFVTVAAATLPSVPLDFDGNKQRILESIRLAKEGGARLRTGPELEVSGYGCLDHFLEGDTFSHSWEVLADIINDPISKDMLLDIGIPVRHRNVRYNTRVMCTYRHVYGIRAKQSMANSGLYREARHFTSWSKPRTVEPYYLEEVVRNITGQRSVPIGDFIVSTMDTSVTCETCEELFTPNNPSTASGLNGAEIILNSSASHAELRKLRTRLELIANSTRKLGGVYIYANAIGVDGEARMLFDGSSLVIVNGDVVAQGSQYSLLSCEVTIATIDIEQVRSFRSNHSRGVQAAMQEEFPRIECDLFLGRTAEEIYLSDTLHPAKPIDMKILDPMEEIRMSTSVYLWQYLTRTNSAGFFLALSGGLDSATVCLMVYGMCKLVLLSIERGEKSTLADLRRVTGEPDFTPKTPQEIVNRLLHTCYMGTVNSSEETQSRSRRLSETVGAYHSNVTIDEAVTAFEDIAGRALNGFKPRYEIHGGTRAEQLAKQNVQARARMVLQYELAQLSTTSRKLPRAGSALLVLGSGNVDENLRGYYTKYDASSADLAPLGSISKNDAKAFLRWAMVEWKLDIIKEFVEATPTAELLPLEAGVQDDESDAEMGMTYEELSVFGLHRIRDRLGPWSMYLRLLTEWDHLKPRAVAEKVIRFFFFHSLNRHKSTIVTPSVHLCAYNPDDNRHDERPFLYVVSWPYQKRKIMAHVEELERKMTSDKA